MAGCITRCDGLVQVQTAGQQNLTVQAAADPSPAPIDRSLQSTAGDAASGPTGGSNVTSTITQIQFSCQLYCFGNSSPGSTQTTPGDARLLAELSTLQQLLSSPNTLDQLLAGQTGLEQLLAGQGGFQQLLANLATAPQLDSGAGLFQASAPDAMLGIDRTATDQTGYQAQVGGPGTVSQLQVASQANATLQPVLPALLAGAGASPAGGAGAANQAVQAIWQLQVGCIFYCVNTEQVQQASQSDKFVSFGGASTGSRDTVANSAVMRIWQLQIGCLFWCSATLQVQSALSKATTFTRAVPLPAGSGAGTPSASGGDGTGGSAAHPPPAAPAAHPAATSSVGQEGSTPPQTAPLTSPPPSVPPPAGQAGAVSSPPASQQTQIASPPLVPAPRPGPSLSWIVTVDATRPVIAAPSPAIVAFSLGAPAPVTHRGLAGLRVAAGPLQSGAAGPTARSARRSAGPAPTIITLAPQSIREVAPRAGAMSPSTLLLALGGVALLFLVAFIMSAARGMTPGV